MDPTPSIWKELLKRSSALRRRYGDIPGGPEDTRSLALRAAAKFPNGGLPNVNTRDHLYAVWTKALYSVLNDLRRRQKTAQKHGFGHQVQIEDYHSSTDAGHDELLSQMIMALKELEKLDQEMEEQKAQILTMRYLGGLKWSEIAAELGSSITSVRREAQFAIAWMRNELIQSGVQMDNLDVREAGNDSK
ncbi:MAG: hypothetical protein KJ970_02410 [Candidatus Eisenbacteria bacterium]|uniref:RNA polymerase sigma-70 ECF-like HTH domain-containing protein n=1 Tax=Eiseniibacteriota bacterium TaxID=2212470 RepID=A0A948RSF3_UNCEI|nr:hypothetical protein [Candidatus Eisenbacteria bacterium]MBU1950870.1 hypothetical protein [Candidatus Eisenbacteria bacterium]MBU2689751.1 hypothetical protein [Candidatus Eisenbacteria bacterium]